MLTNERTSERPLGLRRRNDVIVVPQRFDGEDYRVVKDPVALRYVRLREGEFAIWEALDGRRSLDDLAVLYETRFPPQRIKVEEVARFIGMLHQAGLLVSDRPGQGGVLHRRGEERRRRERRSRWLNPLAVKFRGVDPGRLLEVLYRCMRPLFTRAALVGSLLLMAAAAMLIAVRWSEFTARLPTFYEFFTPGNLLVLTVVTAGVKVLHEFGHGLACRHFGGECHEMGLMFLVFTPCLYCDVTDAWCFPDKRKRAAVGAAGIFVELNLAAIATFVWWFSEPGLLNQVCLGVMTVASISTIVFNGNPLMRYDGYYVLSDLAEAPNLGERSAEVLRYYFSRIVLGMEGNASPTTPPHRHGWYAFYAVCSGAYRWFVTFSIIVFLVAAARPYRMENPARLLGLLGVAALVLGPLVRLKRLVTVPGGLRRMRKSRIVWSGLVGALLLGLFFVPLPLRIFAPLEMQPHAAAAVYVEVPGRLVEAPITYGATVAEGTVVARLENYDLVLGVEQLRAQCDGQRLELASLRREQFANPAASAAIPRSEKLLKSFEEQLRRKTDELERLTVVARRGGVLYPPADTPPVADAELPTSWTGRPLDPINSQCTFDVGSVLGHVGDAGDWQAVVVVDQEDVEFLKIGDSAEILLDAFPDRIFAGRVEEIALGELLDAPRRLSSKGGGEVSTESEANSTERPTSTSYQVRIRVEDREGAMRVGWRGTARIHAAPHSLGARLWRRFSRTFHFHL
jgi:putative peptide zinc metalloprotease protein